jgi:N-ethylmaleimide reductase
VSERSLLFTPTVVAGQMLPHRVVMAPMTRARSTQPGDVPNTMNARYYAQRASAALIVTEATQISPQGKGYSFTPGIYSAEQIEGRRLVTQAVHAADGRILLQLWQVGRMSHPDFHDGELPVAPSAVPFEGKISRGPGTRAPGSNSHGRAFAGRVVSHSCPRNASALMPESKSWSTPLTVA